VNRSLEEILKSFHAEARFVKDLTQRSDPKTSMIRDNHPRVWTFAAENHMASFLPLKHETNFLKNLPEISP
jgi:hypothetical protein